MATELGEIVALIIDRYLVIVRSSSGDSFSAVTDAIADVLYQRGFVVLTLEYYKDLEVRRGGK